MFYIIIPATYYQDTEDISVDDESLKIQGESNEKLKYFFLLFVKRF